MICYSHNENSAIGICKACNKAVCRECVIDTGNGLACSTVCEKEVQDINNIVARSKQIYNIGTKGNSVPSGILVYIFFAVLFLGWGAFQYIARSRLDEFTLIMGLGFGVMGVIIYRRIRKLNLNC